MSNNPMYEYWDNNVHPKIPNHIKAILPEFEFKETSRAFISTNQLLVNGDNHTKSGKVEIYQNNPEWIIDWVFQENSKTLLNYLVDSPLHPSINCKLSACHYVYEKVGVEPYQLGNKENGFNKN